MSDQVSPSVLKQSLRSLIGAVHAVDATLGQMISAGGSGPIEAPADRDRAVLGAVGLTPGQRLVCERVVNVFETGSTAGRYGAISIFEDGPNDIRQITYGRSQTTEYGNLRELVGMYVDAGGRFSDELRTYVPLIGRTALVDDGRFKDLLRRAGNEDPVMRRTQDVFFDRRYFQPALRWADGNGFRRALSILVIYDSWIQSGGILDLLRARFPEPPPALGGDEQAWTRQYVDVRHAWLSTHHRPAVRASIYRTRDLAREIARGNWDLGLLPVMANGVPVDDREAGMGLVGEPDAGPGLLAGAVPYLGDVGDAAADWGAEEVWSEVELASPDLSALSVGEAPAAAESVPALAARILDHPGISLATRHVTGAQDGATARQNIVDAAAGRPARRSSHGTAPGGTVPLDARLLGGLLGLANRYSFSVSELAGGSHNPNSRHYVGTAADINVVNGRRVGAGHPDAAAFQALCRILGATEVLGPGDKGHSTHIHAAWPRPA